MKTKKQNFLLGILSMALSLLTAILSLILLFILAYLLHLLFPNMGENLNMGIVQIIVNIFIAITCYFICRHNPKSIWYVPILCNAMGIISAIVEPNFWITSMWIFVCSGWILSLIGAISGAKAGRKIFYSQNNTRMSQD